MADSNTYSNPLITRYASREMAQMWSQDRRIQLWRQLWIYLAEAQQELGLDISDQQLDELRSNQLNLNLDVAAKYEKDLRHDVMAHVHAFGDQCPNAKRIIHWGATSCYVTDNSDILMNREALAIVEHRLVRVIRHLCKFAQKHAALPCLAYTHLQPAQPTTVGKRATLWAYDLLLDLDEIIHRRKSLRCRSVKGTTGTQASFLQLFDGDHEKVRTIEAKVTEKMGFEKSYAVTGQTYPRKVDAQLLDALSGIAQSLHKIGTDIRLLANRKELEEPFEKNQIGSSAMAYKRNPMRSERICSLARLVMSLQSSPAMTASTQWFERTLDDSANRRISIPEAFLAIDACLMILENVVDGLVVYEKTIAKNLNEELPFMATESILMAAVAAGGDRQELHERIRQHSVAAAKRVKMEAESNDLLDRIRTDEAFSDLPLEELIEPSQFVGRAPQQVAEFIDEEVEPILARALQPNEEISVELRV